MRTSVRRSAVLIVASSLLLFTLLGCGSSTPNPTPKVVSVTIDQGDQMLPVGGSVHLSATVEVQGAATRGVTWSTDDAAIASVAGTGSVTAVSAGIARITATSTFDPSKSGSVRVSVGDPAAPLWAGQFGTDGDDQVRAITTDADGNVIVVGSTTGALEGTSAGGTDVFVRKFGPDGSVAWTRQFGTDVDDDAYGVATDADGNVIVAGETYGGLEGGALGGSDVFVRKLSKLGATMWTRQFGTAMHDDVHGVATDAAGNVFLAGGTGAALEGTSAGGFDVYVRKYQANGVLGWTHQFGTSADESARAVAIDAAGNVVVAGFTRGGLQGTSAGASDVFVRKLTSAGVPQWTRQLGTSLTDSPRGVATDSQGNVIVAGYTDGDIEGASAGEADVFLRKLDQDGGTVWTRQFGTSEEDRPGGVAIGAQDSIIVAGYTAGGLMGVSAGDDDGFVRWFDASGAMVRTEQFGSSAADRVSGVATDAAGNVIVAGETSGSLEGGTAGGDDAFVRVYAP